MSASIPDDKIAEIKGACNIVHLISEYVALKKYGVNYRGLCPFHAENEPSFTVSEAKQIFHCFGCNTGGNVFTFLMKFEHLSFPEAVRKVAQKYGIALPSREPTPREKQIAGEKEGLFALNELAASYYSGLLNAGEGAKARAYLAERRMTPETIRSFKLGYASPAWDGLLLHLKARGCPKIGHPGPGPDTPVPGRIPPSPVAPVAAPSPVAASSGNASRSPPSGAPARRPPRR